MPELAEHMRPNPELQQSVAGADVWVAAPSGIEWCDGRSRPEAHARTSFMTVTPWESG
jgi:hypothetical protein